MFYEVIEEVGGEALITYGLQGFCNALTIDDGHCIFRK